MAEISQFRFPTDIRFGAGSRKMLAEVKAENFPVGLFGDGYITAK